MSDQMPENYGQGFSAPDNVNGDSAPVGESTDFGDGGTANSDSQESTGTGYNPNWDEALSGLPPEFHDKLKPVFGKWDQSANQRYEKVQQEYAPYKVLAENQVSIDEVRQAFELRNQLSANPQEMFNRLASHLGIDLNRLSAGNAAQNPNGDESQGLNADDPEDEDPRYTQLKRQNEAVIQYLAMQEQEQERIQQTQQQQKMEESWYNDTKSQLDSLESTYGKFDRNRAVQFAIWEAERTGQELSLEAGVKAMNEFRSNAIQTSANQSAADVFSGNGSLASGRVDTKNMSDAEFEQYAIAKIRAKNGG